MTRPILLSIPLTLAAAFLFAISPASASDFADRDLLVETLDRYGDTALALAQADLAEAEQALLDAEAAGDQEEADRLDEVIPGLQDDVTRNENFEANVEAIVGAMSDGQVLALNRSLQNTRSNGIVPTLGLDELQRIVDESFDDAQIRSYVMAYRENAKFLAKAERFDVGSKQYDRAVAKAQSKQDKFLEKAELAADPAASDSDATDELTKSLAAKQARAAADLAAKDAAKDAVKDAAQGFAKNEARRSAKRQAVKLAKQERTEESKGLAKGKKK